ncbi:MAG TPA: ORF6N domain-containing protein [Methylomirabilota bacterium]|nr:ORF6N domain-containing protein [Methylomirabilota bacterium]
MTGRRRRNDEGDASLTRMFRLRGHLVILDRDLAAAYGVETRHLNQQVRRNRARFPGDLAFRLSAVEAESIRALALASDESWYGRPPWAFTERGAAMLATVLNNARATAVALQILRAQGSENLFSVIRAAILEAAPNDASDDAIYTYFIRAGMDGPIKIGSTRNFDARFRSLMTMSPLPLNVVAILRGDHEAECHAQLRRFRLHGEWFAPSPFVMAFIRGCGTSDDPEAMPVTLPPGRAGLATARLSTSASRRGSAGRS